jgi:ElaB/YqjD/DUF883 family membrane-anchored ribosome-binding protein
VRAGCWLRFGENFYVEMTDMLEQTKSSKSHQGASPTAASKESPEPRASKKGHEPAGLAESADHALQSVGTLYNAVDAIVSQQVRERPYVALAAAAGVGFILGGGVRSPFGQVLMRVGVRAFGPPLVNAALHATLERAGLTQQHE